MAMPRLPDGTPDTARILGAGTPRPALPPGARALTKEDEYNFDCGGFLRLPDVLSTAELAAANAAFDSGELTSSRAAQSQSWDPVAGVRHEASAMLSEHPVLQGHLIQLFWSEETGDMRHGSQFKLESPPQQLPTISTGSPTPPLTGGTASDGSIDTSRFYFNEAGHRFCHGIKVIIALSAAPEGSGGYALVVGSHKSTVATPESVRAGAADTAMRDLGVLQMPALAAGDMLLVASSLLQGSRPWHGVSEQRLLLGEFTAGQARSTHQSPTTLEGVGAQMDAADGCATGSSIEWLSQLTPAQQRVLTGAPPSPPGAGYPSVLVPNPALSEERLLEFFFWDLCGYLILRGAFEPADEAAAAVDWALQSGVLDPNDGRDALSLLPADPEGPARAGTDNPKSLMGACSMPEPYCQPFRQMVSHAPVLERLEWIMGPGFRLGSKTAAVRLMNKGNRGQLLHAGLNENHKDYHYSFAQSGRVYNESVNVSFQLCDSCSHGGGLIVVPGGHKANYLMPTSMAFHGDLPLATVHPKTKPGDVIIFCGMGTVHGVVQWRSDHQRRIVILSYLSHSMMGKL